MVQKAILEIDCSKGVQKNTSAGGRFYTQKSVTAVAAEMLRKSAASAVQPGDGGQNAALVNNGVIMVQYNPASIKYHARSSTNSKEEEKPGDATRTITTISRTSTVDMSLELVFHSSNDTDESVREQMELIMDMIYDSPTKRVKFAWGKLQTEGKLTSFSGEYNMFDATGRPIGGRMSLTIRVEREKILKQTEKVIDKLDEKSENKPVEQSKQSEQPEQPKQPEQAKQPEQPKQPEQLKQPEQPEQTRQSTQMERS